ncbi:PLP-dependent transferase [Aspergillus stella-maris]|uniref:PLP-dependent transferase n=1 Tax=Aspergillus stella-maris TaxID=1810926 RepID=UPI003CCDCEBB
MASKPLFPVDSFQIPSGTTHVCAAGETPALKPHNAAFTRYMTDKSSGHVGPASKNVQIDHVRSVIAKEWKVSTPEIGFASSVADAVSMLLESLDWKEGDNVALDADDFPSLIAPFAVKSQGNKERGSADIPAVRYANPQELSGAVDSQTRLIAVSYVSYLNGARVNLSHYRAVADSVGAILVVDYSQAAGYMAIDATIADFAFTACHKWLLGVTGAAIACWNKTRQPSWKPSTAGWHSLDIGHPRPDWGKEEVRFRDDALCFTRGNPSHLSIYLLRESVDFLSQWDAVDIEKHVLGLSGALLEGLEKEGIHSSTPWDRDQHAGNVTVHCDGATEIVNGLRNAGIYAWNSNGRVRFSFHGYNCFRDVDRVLEVFPPLWRRFNV